MKQKDLDALRKIAEFEKSTPFEKWRLGWAWHDVGVFTGVINSLIVQGLVKVSYKSNSGTNYMLTDLGKSMAAGELLVQAAERPSQVLPQVIPSEMFADIVGYDNIKTLLAESLQLEKPVHVLLVGPPSLAKSMFLWDIEQVFGDLSLPLIGSATSHAGLWDMIAEKQPKVILVDEIEKMGLPDQAALLALMEQGRIIRAKVGRRLDEKITVWVIAAANRTYKMPAELLSRFSIHHLQEYSAPEFRKVVTSVLVSRESTHPDTASEIALKLVGKTHDVRDAVRVARLASRVGVNQAIELLGLS